MGRQSRSIQAMRQLASLAYQDSSDPMAVDDAESIRVAREIGILSSSKPQARWRSWYAGCALRNRQLIKRHCNDSNRSESAFNNDKVYMEKILQNTASHRNSK